MHTLRYLSVAACLVGMSSPAWARISLTLGGMDQKSHYEYIVTDNRSISGQLEIGLGLNFRLSYTYRHANNLTDGYKEVVDAATKKILLKYYREDLQVNSHSLDLTIVLYNGQVFMPYIFGGAMYKQMIGQIVDGEEVSEMPTDWLPVPNGGAGFGLMLNRDFSLKCFYEVSPGYLRSVSDPNKVERILDTYWTVGITYELM